MGRAGSRSVEDPGGDRFCEVTAEDVVGTVAGTAEFADLGHGLGIRLNHLPPTRYRPRESTFIGIDIYRVLTRGAVFKLFLP